MIGLTRDRGREPIRDDAVVRFLGDTVADADEKVGRSAGSALKPYEERMAAEVLLPHLRDPRPHVRSSAVWGIWAHSDDDVVAELARLLREDADATVRKAAAWGLGVTGNPRAEAPLLEAIASDADSEAVEKAKESLGWLRKQADE